ncbi:BRO-N domain-containing protein [Azospirillum picis]|uniref:Prophage antirepressor-like protein n=1 Tax=Azospirillum picis TaxID=488438 RepID=A0ABU0MVF4_9PROT|nr:Bro-N domain-containing protein [Azospirillum picis]MBP2303296.1 prophage antirepressor-like protein [Azospirillum picis]MDQ0537164.1 prophage antirepressor-like protein [Azospirillum picis]
MTDIIPFDFDGLNVRVLMRAEGEAWFVAADVAKVLEIGRTDDAVRRLDEDERDADTIRTPGGDQKMVIINESGLYSLILTSRKPAAKRFKKWVTAEVLPSIRRTGRYQMPAADEALDDDATPAVETDYPGRAEQEYRIWLEMVREARLVAGREAARRMWARTPLPPLGLDAVEPAATDVEAAERAAECLSHLLRRSPAPPTGWDGRWHGMFLATHVATGRQCLVIANQHSALERVFAATPWANSGWRAVLARLPGILQDQRVVRFGPRSSRASWVPVELLPDQPAVP